MTSTTHQSTNFIRSLLIIWIMILITISGISIAFLINVPDGNSANAPPPVILYQQDDEWVCGDGICDKEKGEGVWNCSQDCSECGDNTCRPEEVDTCPQDCPVSVTCGDGICSAFENRKNCPTDCQNAEPTDPPTANVTNTPKPTTTNTPFRVTETPTPGNTPTPTATTEETDDNQADDEESPSETPSTTPRSADDAGDSPTAAPLPEPESTPESAADAGQATCDIVSDNTIASAVVKAALAMMRSDDFSIGSFAMGQIIEEDGSAGRGIRRTREPKVWVLCQGEASPREVCVPANGVTADNLYTARLLDCDPASSVCQSYQPVEVRQGQVCFVALAGQAPITCTDGCTLQVDEPAGLAEYAIPFFILLIIISAVILLIAFLNSRREQTY